MEKQRLQEKWTALHDKIQRHGQQYYYFQEKTQNSQEKQDKNDDAGLLPFGPISNDLKTHEQSDIEEISDEAFDALKKELEALEKKYSFLPQSTQKTLGADPGDYGPFPKIQHVFPLHSLDNIYNKKDLQDYLKRLKGFLSKSDKLRLHYGSFFHGDQWIGPLIFRGEGKIDGLSVVLTYENGLLISAGTRGNGREGENITQNMKTIGIPEKLSGAWPEIFQVRGEVFMKEEDFLDLNKKRQDQGLGLFSHSRNAAVGSLRQIDPTITAERPLCFAIHGFHFSHQEHSEFGTPEDSYGFWIQRLVQEGFFYDPCGIHCLSGHDDNAVQRVYEERFKVQQEKKEFWNLDGVVFKLDSLFLQHVVGYSAKAPRYAVAYKFPAQKAITALKSIDIQVGRLGQLTPVAILEPVLLGGVSIGRASLHNGEDIQRKDLRLGDKILIERAGDVIPYVERHIMDPETPRGPAFVFPKNCPSCGSMVVQTEGKIGFFCPGQWSCPQQRLGRIKHVVKAFDMGGLGQQHLEELLSCGQILWPSDLFTLDKNVLLSLKGWGERLANKILSSIDRSRHISLENFFYALGIPLIGKTMAKKLAQHFRQWENFYTCLMAEKVFYEELSSLMFFGPSVAEEIKIFFSNEDNHREVLGLYKCAHISMNNDDQDRAQNAPQGSLEWSFSEDSPNFYGCHVAITGSFPGYSRKELQNLLEAKGVFLDKDVTKNTSCVVLCEAPNDKTTESQKIKKAKTYGIPVVSWEILHKFLLI